MFAEEEVTTQEPPVGSQIVGFNEVTLKQGWNMLAINFQGLNEDLAISIQDLIPAKSAAITGGTSAIGSDNIQVYNTATESYTIYFAYNNARKPTDTKNGFWCEASSGNPVSTKKFTNGESFWFKKANDIELPITVSGQVSLEPKRTITIGTGWNMIGNAFPVDYNPNTLGVDFWKALLADKKAVGGTSAIGSDNIQVYDTATQGYTIYFLYNNARKPTDTKNGYWCKAVSGNPIAEAGEAVIPLGKGVWYKATGTGFEFDINTPLVK